MFKKATNKPRDTPTSLIEDFRPTLESSQWSREVNVENTSDGSPNTENRLKTLSDSTWLRRRVL